MWSNTSCAHDILKNVAIVITSSFTNSNTKVTSFFTAELVDMNFINAAALLPNF
jgi:hypothetical protein